MPQMDGISVCRRLRERQDGRDVPILMITALDDMAWVDTALAAGATDFIPKPINWALLRYRVRHILAPTRPA